MNSIYDIKENIKLLCEKIKNLLKNFTDEQQAIYLSKYNNLLNSYNSGKIENNGSTLYLVAPQTLLNELKSLIEELENKIRNNDGIITPIYEYSKYFDTMIEKCLKRIKPNAMNITFIRNGIPMLSDFLLEVDKFLKDERIDYSVKSEYFGIITDIIILCCSSEISSCFSVMSNWKLVDQLRELFIDDANDYTVILNFLVNEIKNGKFIIKPENFTDIMLSKNSLSSANLLISLSTNISYKPIFEKYTDKRNNELSLEERSQIISKITNRLQDLSDDELFRLYNSLFQDKSKNR